MSSPSVKSPSDTKIIKKDSQIGLTKFESEDVDERVQSDFIDDAPGNNIPHGSQMQLQLHDMSHNDKDRTMDQLPDANDMTSTTLILNQSLKRLHQMEIDEKRRSRRGSRRGSSKKTQEKYQTDKAARRQ